MRPNQEETPDVTQSIPPLPPKKSVEALFADLFHYLWSHTLVFISETDFNGSAMLKSSNDGVCDVEFVLSHPNAWGGAQQTQLRNAAILAGLVPDTPSGRSKIHFVTEGEASLHFCLRNGASAMVANEMRTGKGVLVVDAGGGTIDLSSYGLRACKRGDIYHEIRNPQCILQGSAFVTNRATSWLQGELSRLESIARANLSWPSHSVKLKGSDFLTSIKRMSKRFDESTKIRFESIAEKQYIQFGGAGDNNTALDIRSGMITIDGQVLSIVFDRTALTSKFFYLQPASG
ncbi:hypothetical protein DXG01_015637 [Tephrocybe rancida]|nr:hypothetical protein DXG01_015637 [Tephrocybe rancida]